MNQWGLKVMRWGSTALGWSMAALPGLALAAAPFTVNTTTEGSQSAAAIAAVGAHGFVVAWQGPAGTGTGIFARRFASDGSPLGDEFAVSTALTGNPSKPAVVADAGGRHLISFTATDRGGTVRQFVRRYSAAGVAIDANPVIVPISFTDATVALATDGSAVFVGYGAGVPVADTLPVRLRRFSFDGASLAPETTIAAGSTLNGRSTAVCFSADNSYAVVHSAAANDAFEYGAELRRYSASGQAIGVTRFGTAPADPVSGHRLACLAGGGYAAAFSDLFEGNLNLASTYVQRFDASGATAGNLLKISDTTTPRGDNGSAPDIAAAAAGGFEVVWSRYLVLEGDGENPDVFEFQIQGQRFRADGSPASSRLRVDQAPFPLARARFAALAIGPMKSFGVWRSSIGPASAPTDIIGRTLP